MCKYYVQIFLLVQRLLLQWENVVLKDYQWPWEREILISCSLLTITISNLAKHGGWRFQSSSSLTIKCSNPLQSSILINFKLCNIREKVAVTIVINFIHPKTRKLSRFLRFRRSAEPFHMHFSSSQLYKLILLKLDS